MARKKLSRFDLAVIGRQYDEANLLTAIETGHRQAISDGLRKLEGHITPEIALALAEFIDPKNRKIYKSGPKPKKKLSLIFCHLIASHYHTLCKNKKLAQLYFHDDEECFALIPDTDPLDADGNFNPQWKYPDMKRRRQSYPLPSKADIKEMVCRMYGISSRKFDDILSRYNKGNRSR
ncbi:MAG TPA: hypothetical protein P5127_00120 [Oscillospiraceae bacterium]|jgi:hypothetical protein|nr:hypothetical protein [Oscillospiraceae bacterium]